MKNSPSILTKDQWLTRQVKLKSTALRGRLALLRQGGALNTDQHEYDIPVMNYLLDHVGFPVRLKFKGSLLYPNPNGIKVL